MASYGDSSFGGGNRRDQDNDRKVFVGGLGSTTEEDLRTYFQQGFGAVKFAKVMIDMNTSNSRGFGFVTFEEIATKDMVLRQDEHCVNGQTVSVKKCETKSRDGGGGGGGYGGGGSGGGSNSKKVHCRNVPTDMTEDEIRAFFSEYGMVETVDLPTERDTGARRNFIFVCFEDPAAASKVLAEGQVEMNGSSVTINRAEKRSFGGQGGGFGGRGGGRGGFGDFYGNKRGSGNSWGGGGRGGYGGGRGGYSGGGGYGGGGYGGGGYGNSSYGDSSGSYGGYDQSGSGYWNGSGGGSQGYDASQWGGNQSYGSQGGYGYGQQSGY